MKCHSLSPPDQLRINCQLADLDTHHQDAAGRLLGDNGAIGGGKSTRRAASALLDEALVDAARGFEKADHRVAMRRLPKAGLLRVEADFAVDPVDEEAGVFPGRSA